MEAHHVDAYVLPTIGSYTAYVDVDVDEYAKRHGNKPNKLVINVYSPEELSQGELAEVLCQLEDEWSRYLCYREYSNEINRGLKWLGVIEAAIAFGMAYSGFFPFYPVQLTARLFRGFIDAFFWGAIIFAGTTSIGAVRLLANYRRMRNARKLVESWRGSSVKMGEQSSKYEMVKDLNRYFSGLDGREIEIYKGMREYCKDRNYKGPHEFYKWWVEDLEKEESHVLEYRPVTLRKRLRNLFLGPKVVSPKVTAPMRSMEVGAK